MLNDIMLVFFVGLLAFSPSAFGITIINQTDSTKVMEIEGAYRPAADKPGDLAAPIPLGHPIKVKIEAYSLKKIQLKSNPSVLLVSMISKTKKGNKKVTNSVMTCYEPYSFESHQEEVFHDGWGFVIHKPFERQSLDYFGRFRQEEEKKRGYGIKCLHPILLEKVDSLEELPKELKK